jgi:hypothetical protein
VSTLIIDELYTGVIVEQPFKIKRDISIAHIRPWIYKHGLLPTGTFKVSVMQDVTELASSTIEFSTINENILGTYAHGFIRFDFDNLILYVNEKNIETEYLLKFEVINYTTDPDNFIGMCRRYNTKTYPTYGSGVVNNQAPNDFVEPFGLELFDYKLRR